MPENPNPVLLFMYLGRLGALGRFTYELMEAAEATGAANARFLVSANNENAQQLVERFPDVEVLATFDRPTPAALAFGYLRARGRFAGIMDQIRPAAVINLMPHVWSPLLASAVRRKGSRFISVIHDAAAHPGDPTARLNGWLLRDAKAANRVITLSSAVAQSLSAQGYAQPQLVETLFHPDLRFNSDFRPRKRDPGRPLRVLFLGRIMAYKGLDLLAEAVAQLKASGLPVELGVAGSGTIAPKTTALLNSIGAEVQNRWIADDEISSILARYDTVVCSHVEASQSGVAATAFGHAMPVVAMPTGGIVEQVKNGVTGILAEDVSVPALARAIARLASEPGLYERISGELVSGGHQRSMAAFLERITVAALKT